jgi:hypothetical protein
MSYQYYKRAKFGRKKNAAGNGKKKTFHTRTSIKPNFLGCEQHFSSM